MTNDEITNNMATPLSWTTQQRKVNDLMPLDINPRKISEAKRMKMIESLQRFNLVDIPVVDFDNTLVSGHRRVQALQAIGRGEEMIDVRLPNRKLTNRELKEYNLLANTHFGEWDEDIFEEYFGDVDVEGLGFSADDFRFEAISLESINALNPDELGTGFSLPDGDRAPFQQMTFTLADEQAKIIQGRIADMKQTEDFKYAETYGNENSNGNALYLIVQKWEGLKTSF